ncbi:hypothetical protein FDP41_012465 [Naegleria fowleri]|uniref:Zn(2)-C6 fungal-type domain-containing protein n=1 Tax=Naegleria fowleri TaxID=5763 RepID=A0A6A5C7S8_NAEFO|nr:uncharacterized protein FDP41_012465 [Naegleria fowleri]KAF0981808.1 hypothetical protein FDP41_012465 [Naegleria fowleri]
MQPLEIVSSSSSDSSRSSSSSPTLSPSSCLSCRQLHRKCSKTLPSCQYCIRRGYQCVYESSSSSGRRKPSQSSSQYNKEIVFIANEYSSQRKRSKGGSTTTTSGNNYHSKTTQHSYHPYTPCSLIANTENSSLHEVDQQSSFHSATNNPIQQHNGNKTNCTIISPNEIHIQRQMNYRFSAIQTLDIYYKVTALGYPVYDRIKLEQALNFQLNEQFFFQTQPYQVSCELEKDVAVLQTLQAVCLQQMGILHEIADQLFMNGKQIIGKYYDEVDSISVLVAMNFMADYMLGNGEKAKSRAMYMTVRAKLEPYIKECQRLFSNMFSSTKAHDLNNTMKLPTMNRQFFSAFLLDSQTKFHELYFIEELNPETFIFDELEMTSMFKNLQTSKLNTKSCKSLSEETYHQLMIILETFVAVTDLIMTASRNKHNLIFLVSSLIAKQLHLEILMNCAKKNVRELLRVSREVIELTKHELFNYLPCCATKAIVMACSVRVNYFAQLSPYGNMNDDLRALKLLANKYRLVQHEHSQLIKAVEALTYLQQQATNNETVISNFLSLANDNNNELIQYRNGMFDGAEDCNINAASSSEQEDESSMYNTSISPDETVDVTSVFEKFRANKETLSQLISGVDLMEIIFESLLEEQRIKQSKPLSLELISEVKQVKLDFITKLKKMAHQRNDIGGLIETEILRMQTLAEYHFEKMKLEKPEQNLECLDANDISIVFRFDELNIDE